jgi:N-methylhydantoinase A
MDKAIRVISVEQGYDPRDFTLVAFGGGGPLHACSLARALRIPTVLIPAMPGALSALGILLADVVRDHARTVMLSGDAIRGLEQPFDELEEKAGAEFAAEGLTGVPEFSLDLRYSGQGYELSVPWNPQQPANSIDEFHRSHQQRYGFCDPEKPVQIVNLRLRMTASADPYAPVRCDLVRGDGGAACYAERSIFFDDAISALAALPSGATQPWRCDRRPRDDHGVHLGHDLCRRVHEPASMPSQIS